MTNVNNTIKLIADFVAALVIVSLVVFLAISILGIGGANLSSVGAIWFGLYAFIMLMSATKLYGKKIYDATKGIAESFINRGRSK